MITYELESVARKLVAEAADVGVVGLEVVALIPQSIVALARVAERRRLDRSLLFGELPASFTD